MVSSMSRSAVSLIWLAAIGCSAMAQSSTTPSQGSMTFGASAGAAILRHRDFAGKPCLQVVGFARPHTIDPNLYDHVITATNHCPQRISMKVCYYQSEECIAMEVPGDESKEAILGTLPSEKDFRFEFREKF
jgi:hypothetical protein